MASRDDGGRSDDLSTNAVNAPAKKKMKIEVSPLSSLPPRLDGADRWPPLPAPMANFAAQEFGNDVMIVLGDDFKASESDVLDNSDETSESESEEPPNEDDL
eukprot:12501451-Heterocapsa_arctica.AAC.1